MRAGALRYRNILRVIIPRKSKAFFFLNETEEKEKSEMELRTHCSSICIVNRKKFFCRGFSKFHRENFSVFYFLGVFFPIADLLFRPFSGRLNSVNPRNGIFDILGKIVVYPVSTIDFLQFEFMGPFLFIFFIFLKSSRRHVALLFFIYFGSLEKFGQ